MNNTSQIPMCPCKTSGLRKPIAKAERPKLLPQLHRRCHVVPHSSHRRITVSRLPAARRTTSHLATTGGLASPPSVHPPPLILSISLNLPPQYPSLFVAKLPRSAAPRSLAAQPTNLISTKPQKKPRMRMNSVPGSSVSSDVPRPRAAGRQNARQAPWKPSGDRRRTRASGGRRGKRCA